MTLRALCLLLAAGLIAASAGADDAVRQLSLEDAVRLALAHNLTIQAQRIDPEVRDLAVAQALGPWTPALETTFSRNVAVGARQLLPWGASYGVGWSNGPVRTDSLLGSATFPARPALIGSYVQPLLKDFRIDAARRELRLAKTSREVSAIALQQTTSDVVRCVKVAYWTLVYAKSSVAVQRQSLDLARESLRVSRARLRAGTMAPVDVAEAESEVAQREEAVIVADTALGRAEDRLRALTLDPADPAFWTAKLEPIDTAIADVLAVDVDAATRNAMRARTDLLSARKDVDGIEVNVQFARSQRLPDVRAAIVRRDAGYGSGTSAPLAIGRPAWSASVSVAYPVGTAAANAAVARALLERRAALVRIANLELQIAADVRDAGRRIDAGVKRMAATAAARVLAERRLDAEEKRFAAGMSTAFVVFQAQRDLTQARNAELRAILDYKTSMVEFEAIQEIPVKEDL